MLNNIGIPGLILIAVVVLVLFGRGKVSSLMGEVGKGITAFKRGVDDGKREIDEDRDTERAHEPDLPRTAAEIRAAEAARDVTPGPRPDLSKDRT